MTQSLNCCLCRKLSSSESVFGCLSLRRAMNALGNGNNVRPPPLPPDAQAVISERQANGRPLLPPLIMFLNGDGTLCYSNAGTNYLLSSPTLVEFLLRLPPCEGLVQKVRQLALTTPMMVSRIHTVRNDLIHIVTAEVDESHQGATRPGGACCQGLSGGGNPPRCA